MCRKEIFRKSLIFELREELEEELSRSLEEKTRQEIGQEITIVNAFQETKKAWNLP